MKFKMLVLKLSLVQHYTVVSPLSFLGISLLLLKYLLITLKRNNRYAGASIYE